jgi:hypothetical protein
VGRDVPDERLEMPAGAVQEDDRLAVPGPQARVGMPPASVNPTL